MNVCACANWLRQRWHWVLAVVLLIGLAFGLGPQIWQITRDEAALQSAIADLGWLGPLALVIINVLQIVIAPLPGYDGLATGREYNCIGRTVGGV